MVTTEYVATTASVPTVASVYSIEIPYEHKHNFICMHTRMCNSFSSGETISLSFRYVTSSVCVDSRERLQTIAICAFRCFVLLLVYVLV